MNKFGYTTLYGTTRRQFDIARNCHMTPYAPYCWSNLACCIVHRTIHNACRNCHLCDPAVMEEFMAALRATFGDGGTEALQEGLQPTRRLHVVTYSGDYSVGYGGKLEMPAAPEEDPATIAAGEALEAITAGLEDTNSMFTKYSPEAAADFKRQFYAARVAGTLKFPLVLDEGEPVEIDPEMAAYIQTRINEELFRKPPTLADLGGRPNPSGAIDLGSTWRPSRQSKKAGEHRFADPPLDAIGVTFRAPRRGDGSGG